MHLGDGFIWIYLNGEYIFSNTLLSAVKKDGLKFLVFVQVAYHEGNYARLFPGSDFPYKEITNKINAQKIFNSKAQTQE